MAEGTRSRRDADRAATGVFEAARPRLLGIAYRILGSRAEAEDAVQDTFLRWQAAEVDGIDAPVAWLTAVCTRRAVDMLRASYRSRVDYVGVWLPEPVSTAENSTAETQLDLSASLSTAFLLLLERLTPRERAAYLLHEIFEMDYGDVAASLAVNEPACRKLVSRAKARIGDDRVRHRPPPERQRALLAAFQSAIRTGTPGSLAEMLTDDVRLAADGGSKVAAIPEALSGPQVTDFLTVRLHRWWDGYDWLPAVLNGLQGFVLRQDRQTVTAVSFAYDDDRISDIFIIRNPDKLAGLVETPVQ